MKRIVSLLLALIISLPIGVFSTELKDLTPSKEQMERANDRVEQERGQRELERQQEEDREKSQAERDIDKIPKETTVKPIFKDDGAGAAIVIPK